MRLSIYEAELLIEALECRAGRLRTMVRTMVRSGKDSGNKLLRARNMDDLRELLLAMKAGNKPMELIP